MKNKVLITLTYFTPHISGLTIAVKNLAELLAQNNYVITILTTQHTKLLPRNEQCDLIKIVRLPYLFRFSKGFFYPNLLFTALQNIAKNDTVIINLPQVEGVIIACLTKLARKRLISFYHCNVVLKRSFLNFFIEKIIILFNKICLSLSDSIIITSEDFAKHDPHLSNFKSKWNVMSPVIRITKYTDQKTLPRFSYDSSKKYHIGFLGRLAQEKGIEYLLDTIPFLQKKLGQSFQILIAGPENAVGEKAYKKKIKTAIEKNKMYVTHLGALSDEELATFYHSIDILVVPSINTTEAFGMVQVEAMLQGVPVVASNLPGIRVPVQTTGMGLLFEAKNRSNLAVCITDVLINKRQFIKPTIEIAEHFSDKKILKAFQSLIVSEKS